jgi:hypothetical protein
MPVLNDLQGDGDPGMEDFVGLEAIMARMDEVEGLEPQCGNKGSPKLDFLGTDWEKATKFELVATEMGGLVGNLPDAAEIVHPKGLSCGWKDAAVEKTKHPRDNPATYSISFREDSLGF